MPPTTVDELIAPHPEFKDGTIRPHYSIHKLRMPSPSNTAFALMPITFAKPSIDMHMVLESLGLIRSHATLSLSCLFLALASFSSCCPS